MEDADLERARAYRLLASLLAKPPTEDLLAKLIFLTGVPGQGSPLSDALAGIGRAAARTDAGQATREFNRLFIGVERGELVPYASYYLTGFLQDRPLIRVRQDFAALGIVRAAGVPEPEDHVGALLEAMAGLVDGRFGQRTGANARPGPGPGIDVQHDFFDRHLALWAPRFLGDLERAEGADFYRPVGTFGRLFLEVEATAFALADV